MTALLRLQPLRIIVLALVAGLAVLALARLIEHPPAVERWAAVEPKLIGSAPRGYTAALAQAVQRVDAAAADARERSGEWLFLERLAAAHAARARLTGSFDDYAAAETALDRGFAVAVPRAGPHLSRAELHFQLHRLDAAEGMLKQIDGYAVAPDLGDQAEIMALRGDIDMQLGRTRAAAERYRRAARMADSPAIAFRTAVHAWRTGDFEQADAALVRSLAMQSFVSPQFVATIELRRGALDLSRGRWDEAAAHIAKARKVFPGYWLADAHAAQLMAAKGQLPRAIALMESVVGQSGDPTAMDALAAMHRSLGDRGAGQLWADRAAAAWEKRLNRFPEASWAHAAEHQLAFGDPARALELARRDAAARPHGETKLILAWALIANRRAQEALGVLAEIERSGWVSAEQHLAAAQAHALLGEGAAAEAERAKASAINPRALDRGAALTWFH